MKLAPVVTAGAAILALGSCARDSVPTAPNATDVSLSVVSGNTQSAPVNTQLAQAIRVRVTDSHGKPVPNFTINFVVTAGGGSVFGGAEVTDTGGYADERWTLGPRLGAQALAARSVNSSGIPITYGTFNATATPPTNVLVVGKNATGIFVMNADGSGIRQVTTTAADTLPALSPDHHHVAFVSSSASGPAVYLVNTDSTGRHVISTPMCRIPEAPPQFSPDGNLVVYMGTFPEDECGPPQEEGYQIVDTLGTVAGGFIQEGTSIEGAAFTADGFRFYYASNEFGDGANIWVSTAAFYRDNFLPVVAGSEVTHGYDVLSIASSPDGQHVAFFGRPYPGDVRPGWVYTMDTDGGHVTQATNAIGYGAVLSYSPDGNLIAIDHGFMNADGTGYTVVKGCPCQFAWK